MEIAALLFLAVASPAQRGEPGEAGSSHYAESAALVAWSADGAEEIAVRLARFPPQGTGTLWLSVFHRDEAYGVAVENLGLGESPGATAVDAAEATFAATGEASARFECRARDTAAMVCTVEATASAHRTPHPPLGGGSVPIRLVATFTGTHTPVAVRPGRREVFGRVEATLEGPGGSRRLSLPGKWHEQTGDRPRFAAAFTYFSIVGDRGALLAMRGGGGASGFALLDGRAVAVRAFEIDPLGAPSRRFRAALEDGRTIDGETAIVRETSVPIEGERRPSATVRVRTNLGEMVGHLNDWNPSR
jgi:hypothetical protein